MPQHKEAIAQSFLRIPQNLHENTCVGVSFSKKLQAPSKKF